MHRVTGTSGDALARKPGPAEQVGAQAYVGTNVSPSPRDLCVTDLQSGSPRAEGRRWGGRCGFAWGTLKRLDQHDWRRRRHPTPDVGRPLGGRGYGCNQQRCHCPRCRPGSDFPSSPDGARCRRDASTPAAGRSSGVTEVQYRKVKPPAVSAERMSPSSSVSVTASPASRRRALRKSLSAQSGDTPQRASMAPVCSSNHAKRHSF